MADSMTFPATFDEFAEQYKIVDSKEVYTNGTELIPIFRVKQWLENRPTADAREIKRGHWIVNTIKFTTVAGAEGVFAVGYKCSLCGRQEIEKEPYCNCGADMRGDTDGKL